MSGSTTQLAERNQVTSGTLRAFKTTLPLRIRGFKEAVQVGDLPSGTFWHARIIEAGKSLNGQVYTEESLKGAIALFEGAPVFLYAEEPEDDAGHVSDAVQAQEPRGLVAHLVGSLEGVEWNETAKALDAIVKVYDDKLRTRMLAAYKIGDIGEGGRRDVFGLSIDAEGETNDKLEVMRFTAVNSVDVVTTAAAGGRFRRLLAAVDASLQEPTADSHRKPQGLEESVPNKLTEALKTVALKEAMNLEEGAKLNMVMREVSRRMDDLSFGSSSSKTPAEISTALTELANDLTQFTSAMTTAPAGEEPAMQEAVKFRENLATFAGKLKMIADELSTVPDGEAGPILEQLKQEVDAAVAAASEGLEEVTPEEGDMTKPNTPPAPTAAEDEFARMSAGLKTALATPNLDPKVRENLVTALGHEPDQDAKDLQIKALQERLVDQAIVTELAKLREDLNLVDGSTPLIMKNLDRTKIKVTEDFSKVSGLKEAIDALATEYPFLRNQAAAAPADPAAVAAAAAAATAADPAVVLQAAAAVPTAAVPAAPSTFAAKALEIQATQIAALQASQTTPAPAAAPPVAAAAAAAVPAPAVAAVPAAAAAPVATAVADPNVEGLGQSASSVRLRESLELAKTDSGRGHARLKWLQRQMLKGKHGHMAEHRKLRRVLGV